MKSHWFYLIAFALTTTLFACSATDENDERALAVAAARAVSSTADSSPKNETTATADSPAHAADSRNAAQMVDAGFKRYGIEKGIITYRLDGAMKGTEFIYFDHWGWREAHYEQTESRVGEYYEKINRVQFLDGERRYAYDPATKTATYFDSPQVQEAANKWGTKDMVKVGLEMLKTMGGRHAGDAKVLELDCEVWKIDRMKTTLWMWEGLTLAEQAFAMDIPVSRRAISVQTDEEIPLAKLVLPEKGIAIKMGK